MYERKFTYTSTTHTSTAAYAGNVGKRKNYKTKKLQKQIPRAIRTNPQTAGTTEFSFLIVCTANGLRLHFPTITTRGAGYVAAAINNVLFGNLGTCALVNFLPTYLAGELLAELDAYRCTQTALALVGSCSDVARLSSATSYRARFATCQ